MRTMLSIVRLATALAFACGALVARAGEIVQRTVPAAAHGAVEIVNATGEVHVRGWDRDEVQVSGDLGSGVDRLDLDSGDRRTSINVVASGGGRKSGYSELTVYVPRASTLSVTTISADQFIEDLKGAQRLQAVSGDINTEQWAEDVEARTISGTVAIRSHGGQAETVVNTVSGDLTLVDAPGDISAETVTGDMEISVAKLDRARIRTTNGELRLTATLSASARLDAEAINGHLHVTLRGPIDAQFDVETFNGDIVSCFGPKPIRTKEFAPGNALRFAEGAGHARVRIKALNGRVDLCKE